MQIKVTLCVSIYLFQSRTDDFPVAIMCPSVLGLEYKMFIQFITGMESQPLALAIKRRDGKLIVNHDAKFQGFVIAETPYKKLKKIRLANGEKLPNLKKYLKKGKKQDIQLILEIKSQKSKEVEDKMVADIVKMVKKMNLEEQVEYIAFSLNVCEQLVKHAPDSEIAYLNGDIAPAELKKKGINGIDYNQNVLFKHPEWVKEAQQLGMKVNVWTVNKIENIQKFIDMKVDYITTDQPLETKELLH